MSAHGDQLKSALGITAIVSFYGVASLLVWLLGPSVGLGATEQIIIIALLLLTWPFAVLINHYRKQRAARVEAAASAAPASRPARPATASKKGPPPPSRAYDDITRAAEETVQWLRGTSLGGAQPADAVYALPWFLVAGAPSSGKTSLALSSGLDFQALPSQRRAELHIVRPTQSVEWRVANEAVLLDTAGRYQTDGAAVQDEWAALVEAVKKHRAGRPFDGVLVVASVERVLRSSEPEIERQAKVLRARLDDAVARSGARFPVYLVFTHADTIEGFREFFSDTGAGRGEVWGVTIPLDRSANAHAMFDVEFDLLYESLMRHRLLRLGRQTSADRQLRVFNFPPRFAAARSRLGLFTSFLFRPNPFSESPLLRGFYFTANVTDGQQPEIAAAEGQTVKLAPGGPAAIRGVGQGFFTEKYFKEVLLRDQGLAAAFQAQRRRPSRLRTLLLAGAGALALLLLAGAVLSFFGNRALIAEAVERGTRVDAITRADVGKDPAKKDAAAARVEIEAADSLRELLEELDTYERESPPLRLRFGLYSGGRVYEQLRPIYFDSVEQRFKKPTVAAIERDLRAFSAGSPAAAPSGEGQAAGANEDVLGRHYDLLKAYLMLSDASKVEPTFLANQLEDYWKKFSPPDMETVSLQQLNFYARQVGREDAPLIKADERLVSEVRRKLTAYPAVNRFYKRITTEVNTKTSPVSAESVLQGRGRGALTATYIVPGSFTVDGYRNHMRASIESAAEEISKDDWVMGGQAASTQTQATDISALQNMYFRDYADHWRKFVKGVSVRPFRTKDDAVEVLRALSSTDSPMERVLAEVVRQTDLSAKPKAEGWWAWVKGLFSRAADEGTGGNSEVEKEFRPLFQFAAAEGEKDAAPIAQYRAALKQVLDPLESASADQLAQTQKSILTGKDDIGLQKAEQTVSAMLENFKTAAAADVSALLRQPLGNLRALLYGGGYEQVETAWRDQLYPRARALESGFPFTDAGESSVTDLARFLNPSNGQFTAFFNERLASSFDDAQGQWRLKEAGAFKFSNEFVAYLNHARRLREALFATGGAQPEVGYEVTLEPVPNTDIVVEIDGTRVETRGSSPQAAKFTWPARSGTSGARITVLPSGGEQAEITFPGEWGLFKMFGAGNPARAGENQFTLTWNVGAVPVRARLRPSSANHPFQRSLFTNMRAPQGLQR